MTLLYVILLWIVSCHCSELIYSDSEHENILTPGTSMGPENFNLNGTVVFPDPPNGCSAPTNTGELFNRIVVVQSDYCYPYTKAKNMQDAGASGVLMIGYRSTEGLLIYYRGGGDENDIVIPVLEISLSDQEKIEEDTVVIMIADPSPIVEFGEIPWIFYSAVFFLYNAIIALWAFYKISLFIFRMNKGKSRLPLMVLGFVIFTCIRKLPFFFLGEKTEKKFLHYFLYRGRVP